MRNFLWEHNVKMPEFPKLKGQIKTDVLIIGGGMAGLMCAYNLEQKGVDYILVEQNKIASGVTKNTTAKITVQHGYIYSDILKRYGEKAARQYFKANNQALQRYKEICKNIDCDFKVCDSYVFSADNKKTARELTALNKIGVDAYLLPDIELPLKIAGAIKIKDQAQFNPLKFIANISRGLKIYEDTKITEYDGNKFLFDGGSITAKSTIVATHFPIFNRHGLYPLKMYQHRSYVLALEGAREINGMYVDECLQGLSFRNYGDILLLGGGSHRTGKKGGGFGELRDFAKRHLGPVKIIAEWATQDCMTLDNIAYIGRYSKNTPDIFVATGFNKWGMTTALVAANVLCDMITGEQNEAQELFSPNRSILHPQLAVNTFETTLNLITPTAPRCPHLGCALKWNREEHSWDCSCHGSRFDKNGKILNNPATDDLKL
ncbi:MAG: FAD-dependent oxidoreductase [Ruminococcaceae bacterium]|nr:FAD-dependent oxidoreductase [Oscillospiraceae bacterium]